MRPNFLDNPPRYTRTPRESARPVDYAYACEKYTPPSGYSSVWWALMLVILCATIALVLPL
jgi:hypothetical protein